MASTRDQAKPAEGKQHPTSPAKAGDTPADVAQSLRDGGRDSLADRAYQTIEEALVTLALPPGSALTEATLTSLTALGRTPVREAILRLAREGLVEVRPRRGLFVTAIDPADHIMVLEARAPLEHLLATKAALRRDDEQKEHLERCAYAMRGAADAGDMIAYMRLDKAFDLILGAAAGNPHAARACLPLQTLSRRFWWAHQGVGDLTAAAGLHIAVMEAVATADASAAGHAVDTLLDHLVQAARAVA